MTTQITQTEPLRINQSTVKRLTRKAPCPQRYYQEEISKEIIKEASEAMLRGQYMEWKLWGTMPKEGKIPILKGGKKKGSISLPQQRIDQQVADFPKWMEYYGIKPIKADFKAEVLLNSNIIQHITCDNLCEHKGRPYIFDLKLTADVDATFGDFAWGNFKTLLAPRKLTMTPDARGVYSHVQTPEDGGKEMDVIQAHTYMDVMEKFTGKPWGFLYGVFDYKASGPDHKIIEIPRDLEQREIIQTRFLDTGHILNLFREMEYDPIPSENECKGCKAVNCLKRYVSEEPERKKPSLLTSSLVQAPVVVYNDEAPW